MRPVVNIVRLAPSTLTIAPPATLLATLEFFLVRVVSAILAIQAFRTQSPVLNVECSMLDA